MMHDPRPVVYLAMGCVTIGIAYIWLGSLDVKNGQPNSPKNKLGMQVREHAKRKDYIER